MLTLALCAAVLLTSAVVRHYIINYGRPFIFSTSMPGASVCILNASFDHIESRAGDEVCIIASSSIVLCD